MIQGFMDTTYLRCRHAITRSKEYHSIPITFDDVDIDEEVNNVDVISES